MVNNWLPEPPNENPLNELRNSNENIIIMANDTSEDDDENYYDGYEPLPLAPEDNLVEESSEDDTIEENSVPSVNLPPIQPIEHELVQEVWNAPTRNDIEMDQSKENEVKMAMANFTLPESSIPDWAVNIPEEQWKQQLMNKIQSMKSGDRN